jgi:uncharacterized damage-inducible protein DinB
MISRPAEDEYNPYFSRYISLVPDGNFLELLGMQTQETRNFFERLSEETGNYRYAPNKWSIKEVLGHVMDTERVFAYRTLCIARGEQQPLPGMDQDQYAGNADYDRIPLSKIVQHYTALRVSTFFLLEQIPDSGWERKGISNQNSISLRALAYVIAGHERHHMRVLSERYGQPTIPLMN